MSLLLLLAVLHANPSPQPRQLGAFYFNGIDQSQVWVDLDPQPADRSAPPVRMNFTVRFKGRELDGPPKAVTIRVASNPLAAPTRIRLPILQLHLADDTVLNLTAPGATYQFTASCENCSADTLAVDVPFADIERLTRSSVVLVDALGFELRLLPEDMAAIRSLTDAVRNGASVSDH